MNNNIKEIIQSKYGNIAQIVVMKDNEIKYSDSFNDYQNDDNIHIASVTKSITSLLIGIAIDKGLIKDIHELVLSFFPEYNVKRGEKTIYDIEIYHLLTMTAPYKMKEEPWTKVCSSSNWAKCCLDLLGGKTGLTNSFRYSTLGIQVLNGIIERVSKMKVIDFANKYLFEALGIKPLERINILDKSSHINFIIDKKPHSHGWFTNQESDEFPAGFGICLSALDLSKIGLLMLNKGVYNSKTIIKDSTLNEIIKARIKTNELFNKMNYGYLLWILDDYSSKYAMIGDGGNILYVDEKSRLVVSITSTFKPRVIDRVSLIEEVIKPIFK